MTKIRPYDAGRDAVALLPFADRRPAPGERVVLVKVAHLGGLTGLSQQRTEIKQCHFLSSLGAPQGSAFAHGYPIEPR